MILSNVDRASFLHSNRRLGVAFDAVYTAEDVGAYKPDRRNFEHLLRGLAERGIAKAQILHTAESLFHDHVPATACGLATCWIHRRAGQQGFGATRAPAVEVQPDFRFASLAATGRGAPRRAERLAARRGQGLRRGAPSSTTLARTPSKKRTSSVMARSLKDCVLPQSLL